MIVTQTLVEQVAIQSQKTTSIHKERVSSNN